VPLVGSDVRVDADDFFHGTVGDAQEHDAVPAGIHLDEVVAVRRRQAQRDAAALILRAAGRLDAEADFGIPRRGCAVDRKRMVDGRGRAPPLDREACRGRSVFNQSPWIPLPFGGRLEVELGRRRSCVLSDVDCGFCFARPGCRQAPRKERSRQQRRNQAGWADDGSHSREAELRTEFRR
jgi:hypothetical protein